MSDKENFQSLLNDAAKERLSGMEVRTEYAVCGGKNVVSFHLCESGRDLDVFLKMINPYAVYQVNNLSHVKERVSKQVFGENTGSK